MIERILVPVDGSVPAMHAVEHAALIAGKFGSEIVLLHVRSRLGSGQIPPELAELARVEHVQISESDMLKKAAAEILEAAATRAAEKGAKRIRTEDYVGQAADVIVTQAASENADLIIMGRRGLGSLTGMLLGSVSHKVMHLATCACMTVP